MQNVFMHFKDLKKTVFFYFDCKPSPFRTSIYHAVRIFPFISVMIFSAHLTKPLLHFGGECFTPFCSAHVMLLSDALLQVRKVLLTLCRGFNPSTLHKPELKYLSLDYTLRIHLFFLNVHFAGCIVYCEFACMPVKHY